MGKQTVPTNIVMLIYEPHEFNLRSLCDWVLGEQVLDLPNTEWQAVEKGTFALKLNCFLAEKGKWQSSYQNESHHS